MSVGNTNPIIIYNYNGVGPYQITFPFFDNDHIIVQIIKDDGTTIIPTFTIASNAITLSAEVNGGQKVNIIRNTDLSQNTSFTDFGPFPARATESQFDKIALQVQELRRDVNRAIKSNYGQDGLLLPDVAGNENKVLATDDDGNIFWSNGAGTPTSDFGVGLVQSADAAAANDILGVAVNLLNYAALRAYTGNAKTIIIYGASSFSNAAGLTAGTFALDGGDTTSADNGGTIIVDGLGRRWKRQYHGAAKLSWFGGDATGATASDTAVQAWLDLGGNLEITHGENYKITAEKILNKNFTNITMFGSISVSDGTVVTKALRIQANDCVIQPNFKNPTFTQNLTGSNNQTTAVYIEGHRNKIKFGHIDGFSMGISESPYGEFYDNDILYNTITNVLGAGEGGSNPTSTRGEDRGDGISKWGARGTVIGNFVQARQGNDCRTGIFVEELPGLPIDETGNDNAKGTIIANNIVVPSSDNTGRFRRLYANEGLARGTIIGNYGRGFTWQGIQIAGATSDTQCLGNVIVSDVAASDQSGAAWSPVRACIINYIGSGITQRGVSIKNNKCIAKTASAHGVYMQGAGTTTAGICEISGNTLIAEVNMGNYQATGGADATNMDVVAHDNIATGSWKNFGSFATLKSLSITGKCFGTTDFALKSSSIGRVTADIEIDSALYGIEISSCAEAFLSPKMKGVGSLHLSFNGAGNAYINNAIVHEGNGAIANYGTYKLHYGSNFGFANDQRVAVTEITSITSRLNTWGKFIGKIAIDTNNIVYVAVNNVAGGGWKKIEDGTIVYPA